MRSISAVSNAVNPSTGQGDLAGAMRFCIVQLNAEEKIKVGKVYHRLGGAMQSRLKALGIPDGYVADFLLVMQEIGVLRRYGGGRTSAWDVLNAKFLDEFVTDKRVEDALDALQKRHNNNDELRGYRKKAGIPSNDTPPVCLNGAAPDSDMEIVERLAKAVGVAERISAENSELRTRVSELETELAGRPVVNPKMVADELMERLARLAQ